MTFIYKNDLYSHEIYWICENELRMSGLSKVIVLYSLQMPAFNYA